MSSEASRNIRLFKVVLLGDATVGKTHLITRYTNGTLPANAQATIGIEFVGKDVEVEPGVSVRAMIWDTAGQERFKSMTTAHFRRARGALIVYDITKKQSFTNTSRWAQDLKVAAEPDVVICLVGNKIDLEAQREVPTETAAQFAKKNNFLFFETSTYTGVNVQEAFSTVVQSVYKVSLKDADASAAAQAAGWRGRGDKHQYVQNYSNDLKGGLKLTDNSGAKKVSNSCCGDEDEN